MHETNDIIVEREGRILLIRRKTPPEKGKWGPPGGHMDPGEGPWESAQREAREEAGDIEVEREQEFILVHDVPPGERDFPEPHKHRCHVFRGRVAGEIRPGTDASETGWFSREELKTLELTGYARQTLQRMGYL